MDAKLDLPSSRRKSCEFALPALARLLRSRAWRIVKRVLPHAGTARQGLSKVASVHGDIVASFDRICALALARQRMEAQVIERSALE